MKTSSPKAAKATTDLVVLSRTGTDLDALVTALSEAQQQIEAATRDREAAEIAYREGLLDATPALLERLQSVQARAKIDVDRGEAIAAALTRRIASVRDDRDRDERKARHANAAAKCDAIRARLGIEYAKHALPLRLLLRDLADAEATRERAAPLMEEFGWIDPVENGPRRLDSLPEEIVDRDEVELWTIDGRHEPLSAEHQGQVLPDGKAGKGYFHTGSAGSAAAGGHAFNCTRRRYARTRFRAAVSGPRHFASLLNTVNLPAFDAYGEDFATAEQIRGVDTAFDYLSRDLAEPTPLERPVLERLEMLPVPPRAATPLRSVA